jgi:hypothetical protein
MKLKLKPNDFVPMKLYLRDAGVLSEPFGGKLEDRIERCVNLANLNQLNVQITLNHLYLGEKDEELLQKMDELILSLKRPIFHIHTSPNLKFGKNSFTAQSIDKILRLLKQTSAGGVCVHPDIVQNYLLFKSLAHNAEYFAIEVLDNKTDFGNKVEHIEPILAENKFLKLVLDTAHIQEMEALGEPNLKTYLRQYRDKIVEIHLSQSGNYYHPKKIFQGFNTWHSLLHLKQNNDLEIIKDSIDFENINLVIEGVIPPGEYGVSLLKKELEYIDKILN